MSKHGGRHNLDEFFNGDLQADGTCTQVAGTQAMGTKATDRLMTLLWVLLFDGVV